MAKVAIVTDSGAYIPNNLTMNYPIFTVPFILLWNGRSYRDGVDIHTEEFYRRLSSTKESPTTSMPTPEMFRQMYTSLLEKGYEILGIHTSGKLTSTFTVAEQVARSFNGAPIELIDSQTSSMEMGYHILSAASEAVKGATLAACKSVAEKARSCTGVYFIVNTLDYLKRSGRIGPVTSFVGTTLKLKPILHLNNGTVEVVTRVRTTRRAVEAMLNIIEKKVAGSPSVKLTALYGNEPERADDLLNRMRTRLDPAIVKEAFCANINPALGVHLGPDGVGMAYMTGF